MKFWKNQIQCVLRVLVLLSQSVITRCVVYCPHGTQIPNPTWKTIPQGSHQSVTTQWFTIPQHRPSIQTSSTTTTTSRGTLACTDRIRNCVDYGDVKYACQGQYASWAKLNCARYCGYCCVPLAHTTTTTMAPTTKFHIPTIRTTTATTLKTTATMPPLQATTKQTFNPVSACQDHADCSMEVIDRLVCHDVTIARKCAKSCGVCGSMTSVQCVNNQSNCKLIASFICRELPLRDQCKKTCHLC